ncbi:nickel-binding protein [Ferruginibacter sp. SUN106]|uniref:nickel-binding protein n=1 Tax=Ferruginibacter sp. SUN106 TaxID=2978348 RepID=UPI003D36942E
MDVHIIPGVKARDVAQAHTMDLAHQEEHQCKCMTYWIDEERESVFCLIDAPNKEAVEELHSQAHGLIPSKIIEVKSTLVESFLGRIYDPVNAETTNEGLKVFSDPSFRILLVTKTADPLLLKYKSGAAKTEELLHNHNKIIRQKLQHFGGSEAEHGGAGFIISFTSASAAVSCALAILDAVKAAGANELDLRIGINAGEPVEKSNQLFGDTLQFAQNLCAIAGTMQVALSSTVKQLVLKDHFQKGSNNFFTLSTQDENLLQSLHNILEKNWCDTGFDISNYCQSMAMSNSQLYRKTISLTGLSPNLFLKDYRLEKAKELMNKKHYSISQITFESGFSSPSYFTKCFKKKYGLLPMAYLELLH